MTLQSNIHRILSANLLVVLVSLLAGLVACSGETDVDLPADAHPIVLQGIRATIADGPDSRTPVATDRPTRAVAPLVDQIGKYEFLNTDEIYFTKIERTNHPIRPTFSYSDVRYSCETNGDGVSWKRQQPDADIYWSDGASPHTFIGYILPHADEQSYAATGYDWDADASSWRQTGYDWHHDSSCNTYYGSIGNPANLDEVIDYQGDDPLQEDVAERYSTERLRKEDLLLTYNTEMQNEDAMAWVRFHHGLASIRVVVTITGYSSTGIDPDAETKVTNMLLLNQPTMYKWDGAGYRAAALVEGDQTALNGFDDWGGTAPAWDQKKDMKLWEPREYHGDGSARTFTFYGITTPGSQNTVTTTFTVTYPDPLNPNRNLTKPYTATLDLGAGKPVEFRPGYCTSININLNHKNEKMTVGAEYMSWKYVDQPDEGALRKNTTFLSYTDRSRVTIIGDEKATVDDATWLYQGTSGKIYDIYGNDGTAAHPYLICTADQLLSFAYEVKNGRDFVHQFVKLDADITLQPSKEVAENRRIRWLGIGDETHAFNGFFLGSGRYINGLYGDHFFHTVGDNAVIDKLNFDGVIEVQGCGVVAHKNKGLICGCYIDGDVKETSPSTLYTGSIVGENNSFIIACAHVGNVSGYNTIGGLVGFNNGTMMACYHCGEIKSLDGSSDIHATVGRRGDGSDGTNRSISFSCYYDNSLITHVPTLQPGKSGYPLATYVMQSNDFVNSDKVFSYDGGNYTGPGKTLRQVVIEDILRTTDTGQSIDALVQQLLGTGGVLSDNVYKLFEYHFSLNEAILIFTHWLNAIAAANNEVVHTNCHDFTKEQIQFLKQHYNAQHRYVYVPATYPKVQ